MSKLPAGPAKGPYSSSKPTSSKPSAPEPQPASSNGLPFGLRRNHVIGIVIALAVMIGLVVWNPFGGSDEDAVAAGGKKRKGKKDKEKDKGEAKAAKSSRGLCQLVSCTDEQKETIKPLLQSYQEAIAADEKGLREAYAQVAAAFNEEEFDDTALDEAYTTVGSHQASIDREARRTLAAVHEVLTAEQRDIVAKQVAKDGLAALFDKGARGGAGGLKRPERRKSAKVPGVERPGADAARAMHEMGSKFKPSEGGNVDREDEPEAEEAEEAEAKPSGAPI
jgi:Spy/CpxP family protein refolding chaperone